MVKYGDVSKLSVIGFEVPAHLITFINFILLQWLIKPKNSNDILFMIGVCFITYSIETTGLFLLIGLYKFNAPIEDPSFYYWLIFLFVYFSWTFYLIRGTFPYWVDDDKAEEIEEPSKSSFQQNTEDLDAVVKPAVDKEIQNIHQDQAAEAMAQQSSKNTGGKNTEITVNVANGLDLNNKTIVLPQKPKQSSKDNEQ